MAKAEQVSEQRWSVLDNDGGKVTTYGGGRAEVLAKAHAARLEAPKPKRKRKRKRKPKA